MVGNAELEGGTLSEAPMRHLSGFHLHGIGGVVENERYAHHCDERSQLQTTILIGLRKKAI